MVYTLQADFHLYNKIPYYYNQFALLYDAIL